MMQKFVKKFMDDEIKGVIKVGDEFYLADKELVEIKDKVELDPFSVGLYLGRNKGKDFEPSSALVELIAKSSKKKVFVNKKSEWLFLCGRDLFGKGIIKSNVKKGLVLVQSEDDENLGYGKLVGDISEKNNVVLKNVLDKGDYLRKEMK